MTKHLVQAWYRRHSAGLLIVLFLAGCKRELPNDVKHLNIAADLPPGLELRIERRFSSFSGYIICSGLNESSANLKPLYETLSTSLGSQRDHATLPLAWHERSVCKWSYRGTDIRLMSSNDYTSLMMPISDRHFEEYGATDTNQIGCANIVEVNCIRCRDYSGPRCTSTFRRADSTCERGPYRRNLQLSFKVSLSPEVVTDPVRCIELYRLYPTDKRWDLWPFTKTDDGGIVRVDASGKPLDAGHEKGETSDVTTSQENDAERSDAGPRDAGLSNSVSSAGGSSN